MNPEPIFKQKAALDAALNPLYRALAALFEGGEEHLQYACTDTLANEADDAEAQLIIYFTTWGKRYEIHAFIPYSLLGADSFDIDACVAYVKANAATCLHDVDDAFPLTSECDTVWPWENP